MKRIAILVVEDEPLIRMSALDELQDKGFDVLEARDADEALRLLNSDIRIDVLFTDIDMPGTMDGLKLANAVRDRWPPVAILIASGKRSLSSSELPPKALFFSKPYNLDVIAKTACDLAA